MADWVLRQPDYRNDDVAVFVDDRVAGRKALAAALAGAVGVFEAVYGRGFRIAVCDDDGCVVAVENEARSCACVTIYVDCLGLCDGAARELAKMLNDLGQRAQRWAHAAAAFKRGEARLAELEAVWEAYRNDLRRVDARVRESLSRLETLLTPPRLALDEDEGGGC